jgi:hypothetical protein
MMTPEQITASIEALQPAPAHETMHQIAVRAGMWLLSTIADSHPEIEQTRVLYSRVVDAGLRSVPTEAEWQANIDALALASDLARDLASDLALAIASDLALARALAFALASDLARARAIAIARALAFALASDLARARALAIALARDLALARALAIIKLLGDRLQPVQHLDRAVLAVLTAPGCGHDQGSWHNTDAPCGTTHCRAGAAVVAHPLGRELESTFGSAIAGAVIYLSSTGRVPNFYDFDSAAVMADIRACAA